MIDTQEPDAAAIFPTVAFFEPLKTADRCDHACPAQALVRVVKGTLELLYCGHHMGVAEVGLLLQGFTIESDIRTELG
jgi:hypothetical protein